MKRTQKPIYIKIEIPPEWKKKIEEKAGEKGFMTISEYIRYLLRKDLGENDG